MKKRVMIVDDHPLFRDGLRHLIDHTRGYVFAGEAGSGKDALRLVRDLRPDLVTVDVSLGDMSGIELVRQLSARFPDIRILMVSMHSGYSTVLDSFRAGAHGYIVKEASATRLAQALDFISRGDCYVDGSISREIMLRLTAGDSQERGPEVKYGKLSLREQQVMRLVVEGRRTREIATELALQPKTVENYRMKVMRKLEVRNRVDLVRYAATIGMLDVAAARR